MPKLITSGSNLQGVVPPSEDAGKQFQIDMLVDAINYHENGDDEGGPCCTGENPCDTRVWLVRRQREVAGKVVTEREAAREQYNAEVREAQRTERVARQTPGNGVVADPATPAQIRYITSLGQQHDASQIGTFPMRTLVEIREGREVSKGRARRLIEVLKRQPARVSPTPGEVRPEGPVPSAAQLAFLRTLAEENGEEVPEVGTKAEASAQIDRLVKVREERKVNAGGSMQGVAAEPGMYRKDGVIYKVQIAVHGSGRPYAKKLVEADGEWEFTRAPGMQYRLTAQDRMTLEQAKEWGALYGTCCVCGRALTDEKSIEAGIGPICGGRV